jgi:two-component system response regulator NreC
MNKKTYDLYLADDHDIFLESLSSLLKEQSEFNITGTAGTGKELIEKISEPIPDLCIIDMDMPEMNGFQASEYLLKKYPEINILILTMHEEQSLIKKMMQMGIKGYLFKTCDKEEFIFAIHQILKGKTYFTDNALKSIISKPSIDLAESSEISKIALLSDREKEILQHLCSGLTNKQIADKLFISHKTIDNHRTNIMRKLDVHNIVELIRFCIRNSLII